MEFSWMAYFVSLFALMGLSLALTLLCPTGGKPNHPSKTEADGEREPTAH